MSTNDSACESEFAHPHADVLGVRVSAINMEQALVLADRWIQTGNPAYTCMTGVHGIMEAQSDPALRSTLNRALINAPDGMPMSWVGWLQGHRQMNRVFGPDFMLELCRLSVQRGYRHYLYGGQPGVADALRLILQRRFDGLQIVGTYTPPFRQLNYEEELNLLEQVTRARPHILWVGLSTPKQELFMARYLDCLHVPLLIGVGAAFDLHTGRIKDAPTWVKRSGLQWMHRVIQEPKRLAGRYLANNPKFLLKMLLQILTQNPAEVSQFRPNKDRGSMTTNP